MPMVATDRNWRDERRIHEAFLKKHQFAFRTNVLLQNPNFVLAKIRDDKRLESVEDKI